MATEAVSGTRRPPWNTISAASLTWMFDAWDAFLLVYVFSAIAKTFHLTLPEVSIALLFTYLTRWVGGLAFGSAAARIGRKKALIGSIAVFGVFTMLTGLSPSFAVLLFFRLCYGVGMGGAYAAGGSLMVESYTDNRRGLMSGIFMLGFYVGQTLAPLAYFLFYPAFGWRGLFLFGGISLLLIPYIWWAVPESPVWQARQEKVQARAALPVWKIFAPGFIGITLVLLLYEWGEFSLAYPLGAMLPTFMKTVRHAGIGEIALVGSLLGIGSMVGSLLGGWISDNIGRKRAVGGSFVIGAVATAIALLMQPGTGLVVAIFFAGVLGAGIQGGTCTAFETEQFPTDLRAAGNGFAHNIGALGGSVGAVVSALLTSSIGLGPAIMVVTGSAAVFGLVSLIFARERAGTSLLQMDVT